MGEDLEFIYIVVSTYFYDNDKIIHGVFSSLKKARNVRSKILVPNYMNTKKGKKERRKISKSNAFELSNDTERVFVYERKLNEVTNV